MLLGRLSNGRLFLEVHTDVYGKKAISLQIVRQIADADGLSRCWNGQRLRLSSIVKTGSPTRSAGAPRQRQTLSTERTRCRSWSLSSARSYTADLLVPKRLPASSPGWFRGFAGAEFQKGVENIAPCDDAT